MTTIFTRPRLRALVLAAASMTVTGCPGEPLFGPPTESECPPTSTLTYVNFGQSFMEAYCTRCHDSKLITPEERMNATSFHDFDTVFGIRAVSDHIDVTTASGPAATNTSMPPDGDEPTLEERRQLGEWIACDMP